MEDGERRAQPKQLQPYISHLHKTMQYSAIISNQFNARKSTFWQAYSRSARQEMSCLPKNQKFNYLLHKSQQLAAILNQTNPVHTPPQA
jgi:hypothetical protein